MWLLVEMYAAQSAARDSNTEMIADHWTNAIDHAGIIEQYWDTCQLIPELQTPQLTEWTRYVFGFINDIACNNASARRDGLSCRIAMPGNYQ